MSLVMVANTCYGYKKVLLVIPLVLESGYSYLNLLVHSYISSSIERICFGIGAFSFVE
jgi:hypothetical protein